jgi:hypothetical protein
MKMLPRLSALFLVSFASATLFACAAPADAPAETEVEATGTTAEPLLETCVGTYTRPDGDGDGPLVLRLESAHGSCKAGELHLGGDHTVTVAATGATVPGTWNGNAESFVLCTDQHCFQWQRSITSGER